ncbi:MAG: hypothetical protein EXR21_07315, partial [Flavobacteriaceae bacterium]|nr:hypothetical protein [Flavobacteriaceae bacterium]
MLPETGRNLVDKFGLSKVNKLLLHYGITDSYKNLTNAQAKYLASFDSIDRIRDTLDETGFLQSGKVSETAKQSRLSKVSKSERLTDLANLSDKAKYASYF